MLFWMPSKQSWTLSRDRLRQRSIRPSFFFFNSHGQSVFLVTRNIFLVTLQTFSPLTSLAPLHSAPQRGPRLVPFRSFRSFRKVCFGNQKNCSQRKNFDRCSKQKKDGRIYTLPQSYHVASNFFWRHPKNIVGIRIRLPKTIKWAKMTRFYAKHTGMEDFLENLHFYVFAPRWQKNEKIIRIWMPTK